MKLSIIIPVYNTERYVSDCLDSCLHQNISFDDYEIIVVNDGSTDRSLSILEEYASKYSNMKLFSQDNKKQGAARNLGLKNAIGEYVWFIDSDDRIEYDCLNEILQLKKSYDILLFPGCWYNTNGQIKYSSYNVSSSLEVCNNYYRVTPCGYIYNRLYLIKNNIFFLENTYYEDNEFIPKSFYFSPNLFFIQKPVYYVLVRKDSTTGSFNMNKCLNLFYVAQKILEYKETYIKEQKWNLFFNRYIRSVLNTYLFYSVSLDKKESYLLLKKIYENKNLQKELLSNSLGSRIKYFLLSKYLFGAYLLLKTEKILCNKV